MPGIGLQSDLSTCQAPHMSSRLCRCTYRIAKDSPHATEGSWRPLATRCRSRRSPMSLVATSTHRQRLYAMTASWSNTSLAGCCQPKAQAHAVRLVERYITTTLSSRPICDMPPKKLSYNTKRERSAHTGANQIEGVCMSHLWLADPTAGANTETEGCWTLAETSRLHETHNILHWVQPNINNGKIERAHLRIDNAYSSFATFAEQ